MPFYWSKDARLRVRFVLVIATATAVISPMFFLGTASGHDFEFHLASWMEVALQWHEGVIFPRWAALANYGFGEPRFVFYPPASWLLGAALGTFLPWGMVPAAVIWLALVAAGLCMLRLAREWLPEAQAIAAAVLYVGNPYNLLEIYYRSDFAELIAISVFPLMVLHAVRLKERGWRGVAPLSMALAAIWLANAPAAVIATYSLTLLLVTVSLAANSWPVLLHGTMALAGGFGLAAFYIVPAAVEEKWVDIGKVLSPNIRPEMNFLFTHSNHPEFLLFNWKVSFIALVVIAISAVAVLLSRQWREQQKELWWALALWAAVCVFLMSPPSAFVWKLMPQLRFVQFPWRLLVPLNLACIYLFMAASIRWRRKYYSLLGIALTFFSLGVFMVRDGFWDSDSEDIRAIRVDTNSGRGYEGTEEYAPRGCDCSELQPGSPAVSVIGESAARDVTRIQITQWGAERKRFVVDSGRPVEVALRLINYPAWKATINGRPEVFGSVPQTAQILLEVPAGKNAVEVVFTRTADRTCGGLLSITSVLILAGLRLFQTAGSRWGKHEWS